MVNHRKSPRRRSNKRYVPKTKKTPLRSKKKATRRQNVRKSPRIARRRTPVRRARQQRGGLTCSCANEQEHIANQLCRIPCEYETLCQQADYADQWCAERAAQFEKVGYNSYKDCQQRMPQNTCERIAQKHFNVFEDSKDNFLLLIENKRRDDEMKQRTAQRYSQMYKTPRTIPQEKSWWQFY